MPAPYLDDATVEEILRFRPVYIATKFVRCYDNPSSEVLSVQFSFESAALQAMQAAFDEISETDYNPQCRFTQRKRTRWEMWGTDDGPEADPYYWHDDWIGWTSVSCYEIEEWQPDKGRIKQHHFSFDTWFKNKIKTERPSCLTVKNWLSAWKQSIESCTIPPELITRMLPKNKEDDFVREVLPEQWVKQYGSARYISDPKALPPDPDFA